jgi:hypothetical protein
MYHCCVEVKWQVGGLFCEGLGLLTFLAAEHHSTKNVNSLSQEKKKTYIYILEKMIYTSCSHHNLE